jgi:hypothetical protein
MTSDGSGLSELQFDRADRTNHNAASCAICKTPITETYFSLNGHTVCPVCAEAQQLAPQQLSKKDLLRAALYGAGAAIAGTILYFAILAISGYELGLIAVAVGWGVGKAVQIGSRGIGGRKLQALAVILTYFSIVGSYVPLTIKQMMDNPPGKEQTAAKGQPNATTGDQTSPVAAPSPKVEAAREPVSVVGLIFGLVILFALCAVAPFLGGFSNIIGVFIIAIGLFEAWKLNRRVPITLEGPFPVTQPEQAA